MKNFKFDLNAKVAIYVPSTTDVNVPTDNKKFVNKVMTKYVFHSTDSLSSVSLSNVTFTSVGRASFSTEVDVTGIDLRHHHRHVRGKAVRAVV